MIFYAVAKDASDSGELILLPGITDALSAGDALAYFDARFGSEVVGVMPMRRISGEHAPEAPIASEAGRGYHVYGQTQGPDHGFFPLDQQIISGDNDAGVQAVNLTVTLGYHVALVYDASIKAPDTGSTTDTPAAAGNTASTSGASADDHDADTDHDSHS